MLGSYSDFWFGLLSSPLLTALYPLSSKGSWQGTARGGVYRVEFLTFGRKQNLIIKIFQDGNMWCALVGENLQEGTANFSSSPIQALMGLLHKLEFDFGQKQR